VGASSRTLARLFLRETGMSFTAWRQQVRLAAALERLAEEGNVSQAARVAGYDSPSAFAAMCRRTLGNTPQEFRSMLTAKGPKTTMSRAE